MKIHRFRLIQGAALASGFILFSLPAMATQYPVTGSVTFSNGTENLPAGVTFGDSSYNAATGYLSDGQFTFPQSTASSSDGLVVTYQLSQTNGSVALINSMGNAVMTTTKIKLHIVAVAYGGLPVSVGSSCDFQPVVWDALAGTASSTGMDVAQTSFTVPPTQDSCAGFQSLVNDALVGNDNSISLHLDGSFPPPAISELIFLDGFETL